MAEEYAGATAAKDIVSVIGVAIGGLYFAWRVFFQKTFQRLSPSVDVEILPMQEGGNLRDVIISCTIENKAQARIDFEWLKYSIDKVDSDKMRTFSHNLNRDGPDMAVKPADDAGDQPKLGSGANGAPDTTVESLDDTGDRSTAGANAIVAPDTAVESAVDAGGRPTPGFGAIAVPGTADKLPNDADGGVKKSKGFMKQIRNFFTQFHWRFRGSGSGPMYSVDAQSSVEFYARDTVPADAKFVVLIVKFRPKLSGETYTSRKVIAVKE